MRVATFLITNSRYCNVISCLVKSSMLYYLLDTESENLKKDICQAEYQKCVVNFRKL
jgi:wyosine [tRNA(Phe)-imidazoG37] synthetase (radical SAM superfamily)